MNDEFRFACGEDFTGGTTVRVVEEKEINQFGDASQSDVTSSERSEWRHGISWSNSRIVG